MLGSKREEVAVQYMELLNLYSSQSMNDQAVGMRWDCNVHERYEKFIQKCAQKTKARASEHRHGLGDDI